MAVQGENIYLIWLSSSIMFSRSVDGGNTFSDPIAIANDPLNPNFPVNPAPKIATSDGNIYVIYTTGRDIFLIRSNNGGQTFSQPVNVSKMNLEEGSDAVITGHTISGIGNRVDVAWVISSATWVEVFFAQSVDGGRTFNEHMNISNNPEQTSWPPTIVSTSNEVYLVWADWDDKGIQHISFARSDDGGRSFQTTTNISQNDEHFAFEPQIAVDRNTVYLVWREDVEFDPDNPPLNIVFTKSMDYGKTFESKRYIADGGWPVMAVVAGNIYIAFGIQDRGVENVGFVRSIDGGATFSNGIVLSNNTWSLHPRDTNRIFPQISADGSNVFVAWKYTESAEAGSNHVTFLATSYDYGETFAAPIKVNSNSGDTNTVMVEAVDDHTVYLLSDSGSNLWLAKGVIPTEYAELYQAPAKMSMDNTALDGSILLISAATVAVGIAIYYVKVKKTGSRKTKTP